MLEQHAPKHVALVRAVLRAHAPKHRAYVLGSRVVLNAADRARLKPHSDLDLLLEGARLKLHQVFALKEAFSESDCCEQIDLSCFVANELSAFYPARAKPRRA